ncbi:DNA polymerase [Aneurinibacillus soli]|uniref:Type-4 uracil-DNA glycosylase n=1 Tax=Aneurinibacillus soli TaxID=1500254 RepID=A0A0U5BDD2_9BACL|nr:uracil-DNA glycosylase [Aneurinibacillus soli]PYE58618.1 DNA polymerase [Aneurinibacillus soli]BAU29622.1 Uracil DNA glycosylase superfamily protein [Aneurinibacillus soli]
MKSISEGMTNFYRRLTSDGYHAEDVNPALKQVEKAARMEQMRRRILACTDCPLGECVQGRVPGTGSADTPLMIVGEGPGEDEENWGLPLVGISGSLLTLILNKAGIRREHVYFTNVVKCRVTNEKGGNRTPTLEETKECSKYLHYELELIRPKVVLALGKVSLQYFFPDMKTMSQFRGNVYEYGSIKIVPTWHPAYVIRQRGDALAKTKREVWTDLQVALQCARRSE